MARCGVAIVCLLAVIVAGTAGAVAPALGGERVVILRFGDHGPAVQRLQEQLHVPVTGTFKRSTLHAVRRFQRAHHLLVDGQVGPQTLRALRRVRRQRLWRQTVRRTRRTLGRGVVLVGSRGNAVAEVQRLVEVPADGIFGPRTLRAVTRFQRRHGLQPDGLVGARTRQALLRRLHRHRHGASRHSHASPMLRLGSTGSAVSATQRMLRVAADVVFGVATLGAVERFQGHHVLLVDGVVGPRTWAALRHGRAAIGRRAAALAQRQLGRPYRWGGETPRGFDCSGLVQWVYDRLGVRLPRVSFDQYRAGPHPTRGHLRVGDLVFFNHHVHVGIYIGHGRLVQAPHTGLRVMISPLRGWFLRNWAGATRVT
jgi:cell wall-associated NlpC family hydrolase